MGGFDGKVAIVTGRGSGLGEARRRRSDEERHRGIRAKGLRINCVGPAYIETPLLENLPADSKEQLIARHPMGRFGPPR